MSKLSMVFFGTSEFAVYILNELEKASILPTLVVTTPEKPQGRKMILTPSPVKVWAEGRGIEIIQPVSLKKEAKEPIEQLLRDKSPKEGWDVFVVASYGKLIPDAILNIPTHKTLNVHPSLLPELRGPSPIESAILADIKKTGVTIMRLDAEIDHGPLVAQEDYLVTEWPKREELEKILGEKGGVLLSQILPEWVKGNLPEIDQNHNLATFCKKIEKTDACINLNDDPYLNFRKIQAYSGWPKAYYFISHGDKEIRVVISEATFTQEGELKILKVIPEGKKEMAYDDFMRGYK